MERELALRATEWNLDAVVAELEHSRDVSHNVRHLGKLRPPPLREAIGEALDGIAAALFPAHFGAAGLTPGNINHYVRQTLEEALSTLCEQAGRTLPFSRAEIVDEGELEARAHAIIGELAARLPEIRGLLVSDLRAAYEGDPAATGFSEILLVYPGITAIIHHRVAHVLNGLGATFLARIISDIARSRSGIDIHPGATIGAGFFIDHGTGVVIGETAIVGERVRLYQSVTLGARSFPRGEDGSIIKGLPRHPIVEDDVVIYAGASILGRITVGRGSIIGGGVWLTQDVPPGSQISQAHTRDVCLPK
ncbi:serine O-acetyltransferase EpsC [Aureimonas psammosilenae]|uniref:serine O-acetyltransferase EpsC n=1 Tax=Aureimonas psammosilenae TaxID=2495496 RepID=UPI00126081AD|nr:serine O-acetyltransferase EpsC [Aureimonas psammosilenae]